MKSDYSPFSLSQKTILVTGSSSGIGKGIAVVCAKMGATVILNGRNTERLRETYSLLPEGNHQIVAADLANSDEVNQMLALLPPLDGVVHCAGIGHRKVCKLIDEIDIDTVINSNFKMTVLLQSKLMQMKKIKRAASIVFISSRAAKSPSIGNAVYSASKGAINSYARCLALELASRQVRVNCVCPAMVWSELIFQEGITHDDMFIAQSKYPLKRFGTPEDVAHLVVYMLSDASLWMTGSFIEITGGENIIQH